MAEAGSHEREGQRAGMGGKAEGGNLRLMQVRNSQGLDLGGLRGCFKDSLKTIFSLNFFFFLNQ